MRDSTVALTQISTIQKMISPLASMKITLWKRNIWILNKTLKTIMQKKIMDLKNRQGTSMP